MAVLIVCQGTADRMIGHGPHAGEWLKSYDPEARAGFGEIVWTSDRDKAKRFVTMMDAFKEWMQVPECHPLRDDGQPNRPLTGYHITFETVAD